MKLKKLALILTLCSGIQTVQAIPITVTGDAASGTGAITFESDVHFTITYPFHGGVIKLAIEDSVPEDSAVPTLYGDTGLRASINGGEDLIFYAMRDYGYTNPFAETSLRLWIYMPSTLPVAAGDILTVKAGTAIMPSADAAFNLPASGDYEMVLLTNGGNVMSDYGVIPEPTTLVLTSIIGTGILAVRRIFIL